MTMHESICRRTVIAGFVSVALNGCAVIFSPHVEPFSFESVSVAYPTKVERFTPLARDEQQRYQGEFLEIRVRSTTNLAELFEDRELNLGVDSWLCDGDHSLRLVSPGDPRYKDASVNSVSTTRKEREYVQSILNTVPKNATKTYYFYLDALGNLRDNNLFLHAAYNLRDISSDVCVVVRGGGMATRGFSSNVIVVPKEEIRDAFKTE